MTQPPQQPPQPGPGQESVWDYPRPPRLETVPEVLAVGFAGRTVARTQRGLRLLETSHPPVYYIPAADVDASLIEPAEQRSFCEFKGEAKYWDLVVGDRRSQSAAWSYSAPWPPFEALRDHFAFYASRVDDCWVGDERVQPQAGDFYGGWITSRILGPFKGPPGTHFW